MSNYRPKKSLGQNYLIDENISRKIVDSFNIVPHDTIIEIGSGKGEITKYILENTSNIIAVEIDKNNCTYLKEKFPNLNIIENNFLKLDLNSLKKSGVKKLRIIGNIPYNITTDILFKIVDNRKIITDAQLMLQEEVAQRITAIPGTKSYGILSIMVQVFCTPLLLFKVSKNCFYPKPKVDSRILYLDFRKNLLKNIKEIDFFRKFIRASFGSRRKTLHNTLKKIDIDTNKINLDFDFSKRAESLNVMELIDLSNKLYSLKS